MNVRTRHITCATIVALITFVALPAFAVIELPRGTELTFRWDPAPGDVMYYAVYGYCNDGEGVLTAIAPQPIKIIYAQFCDTFYIRVVAWHRGPDGGPSPLSEPSETILFVDEGDTSSSGVGPDEGNPSEEPPSDPSAGAGVLLDFDGDRKSDFLVRSADTGEIELWTLENEQAVVIGTLPSLAPQVRVVGNGDMNADGNADLLYLNGETGELGVWLIAGGAVIGGAAIAHLAPDWDVVGNSDHDGDGRADVLLQHQPSGELELWTMNGPEILEAGPLSHVQEAGWKVAASGDYDGDGRADLLWCDSDAGQIDIWLMDERTLVAERVISTGLDRQWSIVAAGDFDGDHQGDIVWQSRWNQELGIWFLGAGGLRNQIRFDPYSNVPDPRLWRRSSIVGAGDYDGDGFLDLLAHGSRKTPLLLAHFMNGGEILDNVELGDLPSPWFVVSAGERSPTP